MVELKRLFYALRPRCARGAAASGGRWRRCFSDAGGRERAAGRVIAIVEDLLSRKAMTRDLARPAAGAVAALIDPSSRPRANAGSTSPAAAAETLPRLTYSSADGVVPAAERGKQDGPRRGMRVIGHGEHDKHDRVWDIVETVGVFC